MIALLKGKNWNAKYHQRSKITFYFFQEEQQLFGLMSAAVTF